VESDLAKAKGPKTVVLVTDGEETCDGDPGTVIQSLIDKGFDFRLNIIGFPPRPRSRSRWSSCSARAKKTFCSSDLSTIDDRP